MQELELKLTSMGLSQEQAHQAIIAVLDFVKAKMPASSQFLIDDVVAGHMPGLGDIGGLLGGLKGLFGGHEG